tara:strand:+ start:1697 stop:2569 length:873 start_codon:yes stop_codon:yes gene_type:complete
MLIRIIFRTLVLMIITTHAASSAEISFDRFVGLSNIAVSDQTVSCVTVSGGRPAGTCGAGETILASQAPGLGFLFPRFNTSLGTLNQVNLTYNLNTGGVWIGRPEDSFLSLSTDFNFSSVVGLYSDHFGDQSNVDDRLPTWNGVDRSLLRDIAASGLDTIDGGSTSMEFNSRIDSRAEGWSISLNGTRDFAASDAFLFVEGETPNDLRENVQILLLYQLFASLDGRGEDCNALIAVAPCGATNRITSLTSARITLSYDYDPPTVVPIPATAWLLGSALGFIGLFKRKKSL